MAFTMFNPFVAGIIFCALIAATVSTVDSQVIVSATALSSDLKDKNSLRSSRTAILQVVLISFLVANFYQGSLYDMVLFAWSGLGSSLGPVMLSSLYCKNISSKVACFAITVGALSSIWCCWFSTFFSEIPLIPGFFLGFFLLLIFRKN